MDQSTSWYFFKMPGGLLVTIDFPNMNYTFQPAYPTAEHERAAHAVADYFTKEPGVDAVLLVNSCARGKATRDSCLDMLVLAAPDVLRAPGSDLIARWEQYQSRQPAFDALKQVGAYSNLEVAFHSGEYEPGYHGWTSGPDSFELEIGNHLAYSVPLWQSGERLNRLKARWLPYYPDVLRRERLALAHRFCLNNLDHIPLYVQRGLYFQSFDRLYNAFKEFLQAVFIKLRVYPIAYDKWIREQVVEILELPELYARLPGLLEIDRLEGAELVGKAEQLADLLDKYAGAEPGEANHRLLL